MAEIIRAPSAATLFVMRIPEVRFLIRLMILETKLFLISTGTDAAIMFVFDRIHEGAFEVVIGTHRPEFLCNGALLRTAKDKASGEFAPKIAAIAMETVHTRMITRSVGKTAESDVLL